MIPVFTPTPPPISNNQYIETINAFSNLSIGMGALFVLALFAVGVIVYVYYNRNKGQGENSVLQTFAQAMGSTLKERDERIDDLEAKEAKREERQNEGLMALGDGLNRIADLWKAQQKREGERDRILSDAASAMTAIVTVGSKPLQQVVHDVSIIQQQNTDALAAISKLYDRFLLVFPAEKANIEQVREVLIETVNSVCEQKKHSTDEVVAVVITPDETKTDSEAAA